MNQVIKVDVWSDIACPWCYIGKRKLENAMVEFHVKHPQASIEVEYHSFFLNPEMPVDYAGSQRDYLAQHKGLDAATVEQMSARVTAIAASVGLHYDLENQVMTNTALGHIALHFAKRFGKQAELKEAIMKTHFVEAKHIGHIDQLIELGKQVGLDADAMREALTSGELLAGVEADLQQAKNYGITGVPFFVVQNRYGISGAQESQVFEHAFETVLAENLNQPQ